MYVYIAVRNLFEYYSHQAYGGKPFNNDYKFTCIKDGKYYLLTKNTLNYAVSKEDGDKFIAEVLSKCTGEHRGFFPYEQQHNAKEMAAIVEMDRKIETGHFSMTQNFYYDMDDEVLFQMLEDLRARSGESLDYRALINYCYPNAELPEDDFELKTIYHGIYCKEEPVPSGVIKTVFPDKRISRLWQCKDDVFVEIREENTETKYKVPSGLIPEIKSKVRELCREPAEAYVENGDWEGYIRFNKNEEMIFTNPDKTLALLKEIASQCGEGTASEVDMSNRYSVNKRPEGGMPGFTGFGMMGFAAMNGMTPAPAPTPAPEPDGDKCVYCGADVTGKKFCTVCGGEVVKK